MEYCPCGNLRQYCDRLAGPVPEDRLWQYLADLALVQRLMCCDTDIPQGVKPYPLTRYSSSRHQTREHLPHSGRWPQSWRLWYFWTGVYITVNSIDTL